MATKTSAAAKPAANQAPAKKALGKAPAAKKSVAKKAAVKATGASKSGSKSSSGALRPVKDKFNKSTLVAHLAERTELEPKAIKAVLAQLEEVMLGAVHKKGVGEFTLPGLLKVSVQKVEARKRRFGKDPFSGEERWFDAKPATVKVKVRALKKVKDAAL